eukprot:12443435-Prorocentrum_lima.AAC.1
MCIRDRTRAKLRQHSRQDLGIGGCVAHSAREEGSSSFIMSRCAKAAKGTAGASTVDCQRIPRADGVQSPEDGQREDVRELHVELRCR